MQNRFLQIFITLCVGVAIIYAAHHARDLAQNQQFIDLKTSATERLTLVGATLSQTVNVRLNHTRSLAAFVEAERSFTQEKFDRFASSLQRSLVGLRSLQLAPKGIVTYLTNLEENRAALGHDLFGDENRRHMVKKSVKERKLIIAGPIRLIQGGTAIIARQPLFLPHEDGAEEEFWGFATVLIDVEPLLSDAGFFALEKDLKIAIRGKDGLGAEGDTFYGHEKTFDSPIATAQIVLPTGSWQLGAALKDDPHYSGMFFTIWYLLAVGLITLVVCSAVYLVFEQPIRLRKAVNEATRDLRIARDEAEKANRAKTEFLSTMSHELRTPVTSIKGALGIIAAGVIQDDQKRTEETIEIALRNSDRLADLIDDVLDVAKIEAGRIEFDMAPIQVGPLVDTAIAENRGYGLRHDVSFVKDGDIPDVQIHGDEGRLLQVFANLMSNAAKFSPSGSTVEIGASLIDDGIRFWVKDNGIGIPERHRNEIFERFSQVDASDKRQRGGSGLGLFITKSIVEHHRGFIDFVTQENHGTTFFFELPIGRIP